MPTTLRHYKHYSAERARKDSRTAQRQRYRVITINWTVATIRGVHDYSQVHRNEYNFSFKELRAFIALLEQGEIWEEVIGVEPIASPEDRPTFSGGPSK